MENRQAFERLAEAVERHHELMTKAEVAAWMHVTPRTVGAVARARPDSVHADTQRPHPLPARGH